MHIFIIHVACIDLPLANFLMTSGLKLEAAGCSQLEHSCKFPGISAGPAGEVEADSEAWCKGQTQAACVEIPSLSLLGVGPLAK